MEVLSCPEHQPIPVRRTRKPGEFALTEAQAQQLSRARTLPADAFRWGNRCIVWRHYCGVVQLDGLTLEILPKIHGKEADPGACKGALLDMLRKAKRLHLFRGGAADINARKSPLLDIFIREFCLLLDEQLAMGIPRDYRQREENLGVVRGKLMINRQLRENLCHRERLYCQYDELTADIPLNRAVKYTLEVLISIAGTSATRRRVSELLMKHDEIASPQVSASDLGKIVLTRATERYRPILTWCQLFLSSMSPDVTAGNHGLLCILFNMNELFEAWLAAELKPIAHRRCLSVREQSPRKFLAVRTDLERPVFQTRPDIALTDSSGKVVLLFDAKWKLLSSEEAKLGISQADLYQLLSYASLYKLSEVALVYPRQSGLKKQYSLQIAGNQKITLTIICVKVHEQLCRETFSKFIDGAKQAYIPISAPPLTASD